MLLLANTFKVIKPGEKITFPHKQIFYFLQLFFQFSPSYLLATVKQITFGSEGNGGDMFSLTQIYKAPTKNIQYEELLYIVIHFMIKYSFNQQGSEEFF